MSSMKSAGIGGEAIGGSLPVVARGMVQLNRPASGTGSTGAAAGL